MNQSTHDKLLYTETLYNTIKKKLIGSNTRNKMVHIYFICTNKNLKILNQAFSRAIISVRLCVDATTKKSFFSVKR